MKIYAYSTTLRIDPRIPLDPRIHAIFGNSLKAKNPANRAIAGFYTF